ncbi:MAG: FitA-like ribbon-helix-helix domain-containing protein [Acidimicrobiales bacterium]
MATVQVRNVPEDVHRIYQARAAAAGMSLQEYLRAEMVRNAGRRDPGELVAEVSRRIASEGGEGYSLVSSAAAVRSDRDSH